LPTGLAPAAATGGMIAIDDATSMIAPNAAGRLRIVTPIAVDRTLTRVTSLRITADRASRPHEI